MRRWLGIIFVCILSVGIVGVGGVYNKRTHHGYLPIVIWSQLELSGDMSTFRQATYIKQQQALLQQVKDLWFYQTLIIHINSFGGQVIAGQELLDAIHNSYGKIIVEIDGEADSMAAVIMMESNNIQFYGHHTLIMFHIVRAEIGGQTVLLPNDPLNNHLRELVSPILTPEELNTIFVKHEDLEISGDELAKRLCSKQGKACGPVIGEESE